MIIFLNPLLGKKSHYLGRAIVIVMISMVFFIATEIVLYQFQQKMEMCGTIRKSELRGDYH